MTMSTQTTRIRTHSILGSAALACALFAGTAVARDYTVTVAMHVSTAGLDLSQPKDARAFYYRLENAAWVACTRGDRVALVPVDNVNACYQKALGSAVRAARTPLVTQLYLATHTFADAAAQGIELPSRMAGR
jgi:UrcA family protein